MMQKRFSEYLHTRSLALIVSILFTITSLIGCAPKSKSVHALTLVPEKEATCTEAGNRAYYTCSHCDELFSDISGKNVITLDDVTVDALGHTGGAATCTEKAVCGRCGEEYGTPNGHSFGDFTVVKPAECEEAGIKRKVCGVCGATDEDTVIPALGHADADGNGKCDRCGMDFLIFRLCDVHDGYVVSTETSFTEKLVLPNEYNGKKICGIAEYGFEGCTHLKSIALPSGLKHIGGDAFFGCIGLTEITLPAELESIGYNAFLYCYRLAEVCNDSALSVTTGSYDNGDVAYYARRVRSSSEATDLTYSSDGFVCYCDSSNGAVSLISYNGTESDLALPSALNDKSYDIADHAFYGNGDIKNLTVPKNVIGIGDWAFGNCSSLTTVAVASDASLDTVGNYAFYGCEELKSIDFGAAGKASLGAYAFYNCVALTQVKYGVGYAIDHVNGYAFFGCSSLEEFTFPMVGTIGSYVFDSCTNLRKVFFPAGVAKVGSYLFADCSRAAVYLEEDVPTSGWDSAWNYYGNFVFVGERLPSMNIVNGAWEQGGIEIESYRSDRVYVTKGGSTVEYRFTDVSAEDRAFIFTSESGDRFTAKVISDDEMTVKGVIGGTAVDATFKAKTKKLTELYGIYGQPDEGALTANTASPWTYDESVKGWLYEAEDAILSTGVTVETGDGRHGGKNIGGFEAGRTLTFEINSAVDADVMLVASATSQWSGRFDSATPLVKEAIGITYGPNGDIPFRTNNERFAFSSNSWTSFALVVLGQLHLQVGKNTLVFTSKGAMNIDYIGLVKANDQVVVVKDTEELLAEYGNPYYSQLADSAKPWTYDDTVKGRLYEAEDADLTNDDGESCAAAPDALSSGGKYVCYFNAGRTIMYTITSDKEYDVMLVASAAAVGFGTSPYVKDVVKIEYGTSEGDLSSIISPDEKFEFCGSWTLFKLAIMGEIHLMPGANIIKFTSLGGCNFDYIGLISSREYVARTQEVLIADYGQPSFDKLSDRTDSMVYDASGKGNGCLYEAENAELTGANCVVVSADGCSGKSIVDGFGGGATVTFTITSATETDVMLVACVSSYGPWWQSSEPSVLDAVKISIGTSIGSLSRPVVGTGTFDETFAFKGWNDYSLAILGEIHLTSGTNVIRLTAVDITMHLDYIGLVSK